MSKSPTFSVVLIAKNESKTLPRLIMSLEQFMSRGGEVVLVDTGSTDNTPAIARSLGCVVYEEGSRFTAILDDETSLAINKTFVVTGELAIVKSGETLFDYSAARNYAASRASNDVVAMPDCDECFTKLNLDTIEEAISNGIGRFEYNFVFSHDEFGGEVIKFLHSKFYDRRKLHWVGIVHEVLAGDCPIQRFGEDIIKLEHWQNPSTNRSGYIRGLALDCYLNPKNDRNSHYFGRELLWSNRPLSAIREFHRHIAMNAWEAEAAESMIFIGDCCVSLNRIEEGLLWYNKAFHKDGGRREALIRLATHYWKNNDYQRAAAYASASLTIPWNNYYGNNAADYAQVPHEILYWALWYLGDKEGSKYHWQKALSYQPQNPKYLLDAQFYEQRRMPEQKSESRSLLSEFQHNIEETHNFSFVKRGDGEEACMAGNTGSNCDNHPYTDALGTKLKESFKFLETQKPVKIVYFNQQSDYNILLHRDDSNPTAVKGFYRAIRNSSRRKVFVGPARLKGVATLLRTEFLEIPLLDAFASHNTIWEQLNQRIQDNGIYMFSCGMPAKGLIADCIKLNPNITCLDLGSAFDPLFVGQTRTNQVETRVLKEFYSEWIDSPLVSVIIPTLGRPEGLIACKNSIDYPNVEILEDDGPDTVPVKVNRLAKRAKSDLIVFAANDIEFMPGAIAKAVAAAQQHALVSFNAGTPEHEHFLIRRDLINKIGYVFDERFHHCGVDNLLWAQAEKLGEAYRCEDAKIIHKHFSLGYQMDEVYHKGWAKVENDRKLLSEELENLTVLR
jgi:glycosyltransferase involved in cell wall biosynthesis